MFPEYFTLFAQISQEYKLEPRNLLMPDFTGGSRFDRSTEELRDFHKILNLIDSPQEESYLAGLII